MTHQKLQGADTNFVLCNAQAATALGLESIDVKGADHQAVHGILSKKKTAATPVPTETVIVPVPTVPAVAVSGTQRPAGRHE